ncbi:MAG: PKD domain-containing protein [Acidimicrobiales bacterium]
MNGGERVEVALGEAVTLTAQIEVPPAPGKVVSAKWDFEGVGSYPDAAELGDLTSETMHVTITHAFSKPGTYFPALRVASQREGNTDTPFARSLNLSRVRVVVAR